MNSKQLHKTLGLVLLLPLIAWVFTGIFFFFKPGYQAEYDQLAIKTYPIEQSFTLPSNKRWKELRVIRTILGYHLLIKTDDQFKHLDPVSFQEIEEPSNEQFTTLINDSFSNNPKRYGQVISTEALSATTNTGIDITLNWQQLKLRQKGSDTKFINTLYKIHYLQWTPFSSINTYLGVIGLGLLMLLTLFGLKLYLSGKPKAND